MLKNPSFWLSGMWQVLTAEKVLLIVKPSVTWWIPGRALICQVSILLANSIIIFEGCTHLLLRLSFFHYRICFLETCKVRVPCKLSVLNWQMCGVEGVLPSAVNTQLGRSCSLDLRDPRFTPPRKTLFVQNLSLSPVNGTLLMHNTVQTGVLKLDTFANARDKGIG